MKIKYTFCENNFFRRVLKKRSAIRVQYLLDRSGRQDAGGRRWVNSGVHYLFETNSIS